jgi:hypothetical protein
VKKLILFCIVSFTCFPITSQESWIVPLDSDAYDRAEELFIDEWRVLPFDEMPVAADELRAGLSGLLDRAEDAETVEKCRKLLSELALPFEHISPILETAFFAAFNLEPGRRRVIETGDDTVRDPFLDFTYLYDANEAPPLLLAGFNLQAAGFSIVVAPYFKASHTYLLDYFYMTNTPFDISRIDTNFPLRGLGSYYHPPVEFRFGRDRLKIGPGRWGNLALNQYVPYYDYLKARFFVDWLSVSFYLIQLNPTITRGESEYLDDLYTDNENPEPNGPLNGKPYVDRAKYYELARLGLSPFPWLHLSIMQTNLIGGRYPWFSDLNPLAIYHNNFTEGVYSVPTNVSLAVVPYRGIKLYIDFYIYDASVADEKHPTQNPTALAYQGGFMLLSNPFFRLGPGRFRLDCELTLVDPWTYGKYYDLRTFTSRIIYVESYTGRFWIDYPLGFYLGPDVADFNIALGYGEPGKWEAGLSWHFTGKGQIDLYGWGVNNDYSHIGEPGYMVTGAPSGIVEWKNDLELSFYYVPIAGLKLSAWYRLRLITNQFNTFGDNNVFHYIGFETFWKIY